MKKRKILLYILISVVILIFFIFLIYGFDLYLVKDNPIIILFVYLFAIIIQIIVYIYVEYLYNKDKKYICKYEYYRDMNLNEIKPIEAGIILNENNVNENLIIVLIYELYYENIINIRYESNNVFIKLNDILLEDVNKLDIDKRSLLKIIFNGTNDRKEYLLKDILDNFRKDTVCRKTVKEILNNKKVQVTMKYTESFLNKYYEYCKSNLLVLLVSFIIVVPTFLFPITVFVFFIFKYSYSSLLIILNIILFIIVILINRKNYIKNEFIEEVNKLNGLKKFLLEFSNFEKYDLKYVELYDKYYLYALSLGITDKLEKDYKIRSCIADNMYSNFKYLIYDKGDKK